MSEKGEWGGVSEIGHQRDKNCTVHRTDRSLDGAIGTICNKVA
jgi:hypothetical protein